MKYIIIDRIYADGLRAVTTISIDTLYRLAGKYNILEIVESESYLLLTFDHNRILHVKEILEDD